MLEQPLYDTPVCSLQYSHQPHEYLYCNLLVYLQYLSLWLSLFRCSLPFYGSRTLNDSLDLNFSGSILLCMLNKTATHLTH